MKIISEVVASLSINIDLSLLFWSINTFPTAFTLPNEPVDKKEPLILPLPVILANLTSSVVPTPIDVLNVAPLSATGSVVPSPTII